MINYINATLGVLNQPSNKDKKLEALIRIIWWKFNQAFLKLPTIVDMDGGVKCICYPESSYGSLVIYQKFPEYSEMDFLLSMIEMNDIVIDVGANIGLISLMAASKIRTGKVYAFEPAKNCLDNLYQNIKLNKLEEKVEVVEKVVSDVTGRESFILESHSEVNHIAGMSDYKSKKSTSLPAITLDNFIKQEKIKKVNVLKIDVEGASSKVVMGFSNFIEKGLVEIILTEINKNNVSFGGSEEALIDYFLSSKYKIYKFDKNGRLKKYVKESDSRNAFNIVAVYDSPSAIKKFNRYKGNKLKSL